jgi:hypothetical protein
MPTPNRPLSQNKYSEQNIGNTSFDEDFGVSAVETLGFDGKNLQRHNATNMALQIEYDGQSNPIYIGLASPGTLTSETNWQIRKLTFDGQNNVTAIEYADGTPSFTKEWDERTTGGYVYS